MNKELDPLEFSTLEEFFQASIKSEILPLLFSRDRLEEKAADVCMRWYVSHFVRREMLLLCAETREENNQTNPPRRM